MINGVSERILTREKICSGSSGLEEVDEFRESGRDACDGSPGETSAPLIILQI